MGGTYDGDERDIGAGRAKGRPAVVGDGAGSGGQDEGSVSLAFHMGRRVRTRTRQARLQAT